MTSLVKVLLGLVLAGTVGLAVAADVQDSDVGGKAVAETKISEHGRTSPCLGACTVNFRKELGVPFEYLDSIGQQIHEAAECPDPVGLATAAKSLAIAEKVSGKKASVTSDQLLEEAVKLAEMREIGDELQAVAMLVDDEDAKQDLLELAQAAKDKQPREGDTSRDIVGILEVLNHTNECLRIFVDGRYVGEAHERETGRFHVHSHRNPNHLSAYCTEGGELVDHEHYFGSTNYLIWHIHH